MDPIFIAVSLFLAAGSLVRVLLLERRISSRDASVAVALDAIDRRISSVLPPDGEKVPELLTRIGTLRGDVDRLQAADETTTGRLDAHDAAAGGAFWRTEAGDVIRIRDGSTTHLLNILDGNHGSPLVQELVMRELRRREQDAVFAAATMRTLNLPKDERAKAARNLLALAVGGDKALDPTIDVQQSVRDYVRRILEGEEGR